MKELPTDEIPESRNTKFSTSPSVEKWSDSDSIIHLAPPEEPPTSPLISTYKAVVHNGLLHTTVPDSLSPLGRSWVGSPVLSTSKNVYFDHLN